MTRTMAVAALLVIAAAPAVASDIGLGAGLSMGTSGVREAAVIVTYCLADVAAWQLGPVTVPASSFVALASTRNFEDAFLGLGLRREHIILNAGYSTEDAGRWEARVTLLGVSF